MPLDRKSNTFTFSLLVGYDNIERTSIVNKPTHNSIDEQSWVKIIAKKKIISGSPEVYQDCKAVIVPDKQMKDWISDCMILISINLSLVTHSGWLCFLTLLFPSWFFTAIFLVIKCLNCFSAVNMHSRVHVSQICAAPVNCTVQLINIATAVVVTTHCSVELCAILRWRLWSVRNVKVLLATIQFRASVYVCAFDFQPRSCVILRSLKIYSGLARIVLSACGPLTLHASRTAFLVTLPTCWNRCSPISAIPHVLCRRHQLACDLNFPLHWIVLETR